MVQQPCNSLGSRAEVPVSARDPSLRTEALSSSPEDRATRVHREGAASLRREEMVYVWGRRGDCMGVGRFRESHVTPAPEPGSRNGLTTQGVLPPYSGHSPDTGCKDPAEVRHP